MFTTIYFQLKKIKYEIIQIFANHNSVLIHYRLTITVISAEQNSNILTSGILALFKNIKWSEKMIRRKRVFDDNGKCFNINEGGDFCFWVIGSWEVSKLTLISPCFSDGGFRSKKRRTSENVEIEDRLESLILRVGEKVICHSTVINYHT